MNMPDILPKVSRWRVVFRPICTIHLAAAAAVLTGCAANNPQAVLDWDGFIASFAGEARKQPQYATAAVKVVGNPDASASIAGGNARFERWCAAHGGKSDATQTLARSNPTVSIFHDALGLKSNAEQARGIDWKPINAVACVDVHSAELIAAMVSEQGKNEARTSEGKVVDRVTRVFFTRQQAVEFNDEYARREIERTEQAVAVSRDREAKRGAATRRLRENPRIGDRTLNGTIVDIRPPLVLVQYDERYRVLTNRPLTEWLRIDALSAPSDGL